MSPHQVETPASSAAPLASKPASKPAKTDLRAANILDIRRETVAFPLVEQIQSGLQKPLGQKTLPTMLLYSANGLKLFEEITYCHDYYLTNTEIQILEQHAAAMAERMADGSIVVELGSGNLRKVNILLNALDRSGKKITYYALDLDRSELERTLAMVPPGTFENIQCYGLHGTYDDGRAWLKDADQQKARCVLWLGSSAGNFARGEAAAFLREFGTEVLRPGKHDLMLIGLDGTKNAAKVYRAYNDSAGITTRFELYGLTYANELLGGNYFDPNDWEYIGVWNSEESRHESYCAPKKDIKFSGKLEGASVAKGERINIEYSYKFDVQDSLKLWESAGLRQGAQWSNEEGSYLLHILYKPPFLFGMEPTDYASEPTPTFKEWEQLWASWDTVAMGMIPREKLLSKPIDLRNPCIFYLGHIPNFLDCQIVKATGSKPVEPSTYSRIFQRGIDPDVDDPTHCHAHSEVPENWPALPDILEYTTNVRRRTTELYSQGSAAHQPALVRRALWVAFEHEVMHLETLLYMLLQSDSTLPPPGTVNPDFFAGRDLERRDANPWVDIPALELIVGLDDPEEPEEETPHNFGWDNEKPARKVEVAPFTVRAAPITNEEYARYLRATNSNEVPASWMAGKPLGDGLRTVDDAGADMDADLKQFIDANYVRTVYGPVPLRLAGDWPVIASYNELERAAKWMGGRIPTRDEVQAIYQYAEDTGKTTMGGKKLSGRIDAVNGHLTQSGVYESPPLFEDLAGRNVGFRSWHPSSVRTAGGRLLGRGETGGAWEWTSSELARHDGFVPAKLYPEYTADFFDGKHNVALGGSWATHPRIAGRKSFVNWYQRNYRYTWATARVAKA